MSSSYSSGSQYYLFWLKNAAHIDGPIKNIVFQFGGMQAIFCREAFFQRFSSYLFHFFLFIILQVPSNKYLIETV